MFVWAPCSTRLAAFLGHREKENGADGVWKEEKGGGGGEERDRPGLIGVGDRVAFVWPTTLRCYNRSHHPSNALGCLVHCRRLGADSRRSARHQKTASKETRVLIFRSSGRGNPRGRGRSGARPMSVGAGIDGVVGSTAVVVITAALMKVLAPVTSDSEKERKGGVRGSSLSRG